MVIFVLGGPSIIKLKKYYSYSLKSLKDCLSFLVKMSGPLQDVIEEDAADLLFPKGKDYKSYEILLCTRLPYKIVPRTLVWAIFFGVSVLAPSFQFQLTGWQ